ncbi:hypothetical protein ABZ565_24185 [Streptomyces sp. NPDC016469]|uniref:hypothetical protein n=1 Tax=Streptomyces sp. NPDC016469 TaxID=3157191 RepID=UPI0033CAB801
MCATPDTGAQECAGCSWRMWDDPVLGALTDEDTEAARTALRTAQHAWDLRAATLSQGDAEGLRRLTPLLRAGPADPGEPAPPPLPGGSLPPHDSARWQQILTDLVGGRIPDVVFAEFTPDRLHVIRAAADRSGIPSQADAGSTDWASLLPALDGDAGPRRFRLAGGVGSEEALDRAEFDAAVTRWLRTHPALARAGTLVVLGRRSGWVLLDRAAALLRSVYRPSAEIGPGPGEAASGTDTADAVRAALRTAPLAVDHSLLLARVDRRTGEVHAHTQVLFPAGSRLRRGETATAEITVYGGLAARAPVLLPVLAGTPGADGSGAVTLSARRTALAAFAPARLAFVLHGPGEVTAHEGAAHADGRGELPDIPALVGSLPRRVIHPPALDMFLTIEMSGADPAETAERLGFARDVIATLARRHGPGLRVGVVGHYDHAVHENRYGPRPVLLLRVPAGPARAALAALTGWRPARREQDTASSLEDALREVGRLVRARPRTARAPDTRRVLLVVGRRPPGLPEQQHEVVPACPLGADWRAELDGLRARGVRVLTRADPDTGPKGPVHRYTASAWDALGAGGSFRPGSDTADDVADALAPPWQWDGLPCPLALATPLL